MQKKPTLWMFLKSQIILAIIVLFFIMVNNNWSEDGLFFLIVLIFCYQGPVFLTTLASLFSKVHPLEKSLETSIATSPRIIQLTAVILIPVLTLPFTDNFPFPVSIVFLFFAFGLFYSLAGAISHRLAVGIIGAICEVEETNFLGKLIRMLTALHFYPVYLLLSRTFSLPWYIRKPLALFIFASWFSLFFLMIAILNI